MMDVKPYHSFTLVQCKKLLVYFFTLRLTELMEAALVFTTIPEIQFLCLFMADLVFEPVHMGR